jgi:hypothetical protein
MRSAIVPMTLQQRRLCRVLASTSAAGLVPRHRGECGHRRPSGVPVCKIAPGDDHHPWAELPAASLDPDTTTGREVARPPALF